MEQKYHPSLSEAVSAFQKGDILTASNLLKRFLNDSDLALKAQANNFMSLIYLDKQQYPKAILCFGTASSISDYYMYWRNLWAI